MPFHIFNTLSRSVEEFSPQNPPEVTLYSCGPTVYLPQHLGNFRTFLNWDFLKRALKFDGYRVRQIMNITDVGHMTSDQDDGEDKIEKTARAEGKSPLEVANHYTELFLADWDRLGMERPELFSRATDHIAEMIALIGRIIDAGFAYVTKSGVYFDVERYRGENRFGRLSRQSLDEQHAANRLDHSRDKRSPHDFALWMLDQPHHILQWPTPWGPGYPGWHIECSAMAMKYLGETIDIHTGGMDHIPIHHENEIAQSESATRKPFARYFVHSAFLVGKEGAKISKSAGKFPLLSDLPGAGIDPLAFRLFCFGAKYRSELILSDEGLRAAQGNLDYFREFARNVPAEAAAPGAETPGGAETHYERFHDALDNDLNTPQALAVALDLVAESYRRQDFGGWPTLLTFDAVLGLQLGHYREMALGATISPEAQALIDERAEARRSRNFKRSDELRKQLETMGYEVKDNRDGATEYRPRRI
ncbi:MAG: cysteine--tRNA ligase [Candidatus Binatus sp.]|uniref:cysteine--tRNA ligase n=1 Tax=Candidatus Binatus sp. TaxID=2811406 RepID=UPI0027230061|nr:cysteine--tRNA ligase [Candidatus Binatus sp.]MDO8431799.1 cysteine--tRNA ligase [Candidatus Binatus sp.]